MAQPSELQRQFANRMVELRYVEGYHESRGRDSPPWEHPGPAAPTYAGGAVEAVLEKEIAETLGDRQYERSPGRQVQPLAVLSPLEPDLDRPRPILGAAPLPRPPILGPGRLAPQVIPNRPFRHVQLPGNHARRDPGGCPARC
jgi:hypothetical protein